ncbi:protein SPIRAL1-like 3 [Durio zibethinus]|uniref:Protein SPIRAL1-like 3 n=1 Tax=Durio zibethinus TaxID=66656 RepID=A0A6P5YG28_DURZI|nr:protein SPIRAL1-like 3 [Durio zibethinus]
MGKMGRGVSAGGGQSSLGYLFGNGESGNGTQGTPNQEQATHNQPSQKPASSSPAVDKQIPAGIHGNLTNNYFRADGQNCGNFITDRPSTKVHAAPGGGSSLGYLFGGGGSGGN